MLPLGSSDRLEFGLSSELSAKAMGNQRFASSLSWLEFGLSSGFNAKTMGNRRFSSSVSWLEFGLSRRKRREPTVFVEFELV